MTIKHPSFVAIVLGIVLACRVAFAAPADDVLDKLDIMASNKEGDHSKIVESMTEGIENNATEVSRAILAKLKEKTKLTERQIAIYVWALGLAKDPAAIDALTLLHRESKSELVRVNCLRALAILGGKKSGDFLVGVLDGATNEEMRFEILNLLGQMQYEAALPKTEEVLKKDPKSFYWQPIFVFGKMGDKAVPFLMQKINDPDRNVRINAIQVLGLWLIPPEAAKALQEQFWQEKDTDLRAVILKSLENTIADLDAMKTFFEQVAAKEKNDKLLKFAKETVAGMHKMQEDVVAFGKKKQISAAAFQREYDQLFKSAGKKGNYEILTTASTPEDEAKLKALRERILQRNSDEAFYDYQKINAILIRNRLLPKKTEK